MIQADSQGWIEKLLAKVGQVPNAKNPMGTNVKSPSVCAACLLVLFFSGTHAAAETMLEQVRQRGAAVSQDFVDDPSQALPEVPWTVEDYSSRLVGVSIGLTHLGDSLPRESEFGVGLVGQLRRSNLEQPRLVGLWGQSWALNLGANMGAQTPGYFVFAAGDAEFGTVATLAHAGHGVYLRFSGAMSAFVDNRISMSQGLASIPFGPRLVIDGAVLELGAVPALGWASIFQDSKGYGSGPLFFGGQARWQSKAGWLELQQTRGVSPAQITITTVSACGNTKSWILCADGNWLDLHDLSRGEPARFMRVGLRIGIGSWNLETKEVSRTALVPLR
jgi:hypothetical protein